MADEQINVKITGDYDDKDAKKAIEDAEKIEKLDPELTITADDKASDDIASVADKADALTAQEREIVLRAKIDAAKSDLAALQAELDQTGEKADETNRKLDATTGGGGPGVRGNAISDLTGPLGEASGAASDFAGVLDGVGDIAEDLAGKIGLSDSATQKLVGSIGYLGVGIAAAAAVWTLYKNRQEEAKRKQEELTKKTSEWLDALRKGERASAIDKITEQYDELLRKADELGVLDQVTAAITGQAEAVPALDKAISDLERAYTIAMVSGEGNLTMISETLDAYKALKSDVDDATGAVDDGTDALSQHDRIVASVTRSLGGAEKATDALGNASDRAERKVNKLNSELGRLQGELDIEQAMLDFETTFKEAIDNTGESLAESKQDVLNWKQFIKDTGAELKRSPIEIETALNEVDQGDLVASHNTVQQWFDERPVFIRVGVKPQRIGFTPIGGGQIVVDSVSATSVGAAAPMTVNVNMPRGARGVDVLRQVSGQARRSGRRYGVPVVHYARR